MENECEFCMPVRDDNEYLIFDELVENYLQIRKKVDEKKYRLQSGCSYRYINYCPICGRKLV